MSRKAKRLQRIRQNPRNVSFDELRQVLEDFGFVEKPSKGTSHHYFRAEIEGVVKAISIPYKRPHIKETYVKKALSLIDEIASLVIDENEDIDLDQGEE